MLIDLRMVEVADLPKLREEIEWAWAMYDEYNEQIYQAWATEAARIMIVLEKYEN